VADSSGFKAFAYELAGGGRREFSFNFSEEEKNASSGKRELLALVFTLRHWLKTGVIRDTNIYWLTDSTNLVAFLQKGSGSPEVQPLVFEVALTCAELGITITPIHMYREDPRLQLADEGSKFQDTDNWSLSFEDFEWFRTNFQFEMDLFANKNNKRAERFCGLFYEEGASGVDAFTLDWSAEGYLWVCPPVSALIKVYRKIMTGNCSGIVVMPEWKASRFLSFFVSQELGARPPFQLIRRWKPFIVQNENARNTALFGRVKFDFIALKF